MAYNIGNTTVIGNDAALGAVSGNSLNLANNANIPASGGNSYNVELFLVGGGGSGGREHNESGGGGHGGLIRTPVEVPVSTSFSITLGAGGAAQNSNGVDGNTGSSSTAFGYTAAGGSGGRAGDDSQGQEGGSGPKPTTWGGGSTFQAAITANGFTNSMGGAGAHPNQGINNANGGVGYQNLPNAQFAGGGGGHFYFTNYSGNSGGGNGSNSTDAGDGVRGSGGGGGRQRGGAGGTGYCVIRYPGNTAIGTGGTVQVNGGYVYHTFNGSGTFNSGTP